MGRRVPISDEALGNIRVGARLLADAVLEWAGRAFPGATIDSAIAHMERELRELREARSWMDPSRTAAEAGDIIGIALHVIVLCDRSQDPATILYEMMRRNGEREWGEPDAEGVVEHIR